MHKVQSKYKNPDKYIKKLKKDIELLDLIIFDNEQYCATRMKELEDQKPEEISIWDKTKSTEEISSTTVNSNMMDFRIGDIFLHEGTVKSVFGHNGGTILAIDFKRMLRGKVNSEGGG